MSPGLFFILTYPTYDPTFNFPFNFWNSVNFPFNFLRRSPSALDEKKKKMKIEYRIKNDYAFLVNLRLHSVSLLEKKG